MFFVLSDSSLVGIYLGVVREDCEIDLHKKSTVKTYVYVYLVMS